ncbi:MAG: hypothetical protein U0905_10745 [Pirellulales bacterium]
MGKVTEVYWRNRDEVINNRFRDVAGAERDLHGLIRIATDAGDCCQDQTLFQTWSFIDFANRLQKAAVAN